MRNFKKVISTVKQAHPILYSIVLIHLVLALACIVGLFIDNRTLLGVNVWIKPLKFCISGAIYIFTVGYLLSLYPYSRKKRNWLANITSWALMIDLVIITVQASRGVQSHYNRESIYDAILFMSMGLFTGLIVITMLIFIFDTIRLKLNTTKPIQWAILMGWLVVFLGSWAGGQMISQMAHNVGVADGGAGLPVVNWSTKGGDLRIAHFFGLHGIQVIPLFAVWVSGKWKQNNNRQIIAVTLFGLFYAGWIGFTFYQAKQGMPIINN